MTKAFVSTVGYVPTRLALWLKTACLVTMAEPLRRKQGRHWGVAPKS